MRILVCDDRETDDSGASTADKYTALIERGSEIKSVVATSQQLELLLGQFYATTVHPYFGYGTQPIDAPKRQLDIDLTEYDIIILDHNLTHLSTAGRVYSSDIIAAHMRAFLPHAYITIVNRDAFLDFDLLTLYGIEESNADLDVNPQHLSSVWLWSRTQSAQPMFAPSYWPKLKSAARKKAHQIDWLSQHFCKPILPALGFTPDTYGVLSRTDQSLFVNDRDGAQWDPFTVTPQLIAQQKLEGLNQEEYRQILSEGLENNYPVLRLLAWQIDKWLRLRVFAPQSCVVDLPHLVERIPMLLSDVASAADPSVLGQLACGEEDAVEYIRPNALEVISRYRFESECWTDRPRFWWPLIAMDTKLDEVLEGLFDQDWPELIFLEDTSELIDGRRLATDEVRQFVAGFHTSWDQRCIRSLTNIAYKPKGRFAK